MKPMLFHATEEMHKRLKIMAAEKNVPMRSLILEALKGYLDKN